MVKLCVYVITGVALGTVVRFGGDARLALVVISGVSVVITLVAMMRKMSKSGAIWAGM